MLLEYNGLFRVICHQYSKPYSGSELMYTSCGEYPFGRLCQLYFPMAIRPHLDVTTTTHEYVSTGLVMSLATRILSCPIYSFVWTSCTNVVVWLASVPLSSVETVAECSATILRSMRNTLRMHLTIHIVSRNTCTARLWTILNQIRACMSPICTTSGMNPCILITSIAAVLSFGASGRLVQHLHWGFK